MEISWKAQLANGTQYQKDTPYENIDRDNLRAFSLVRGEEVIFSVPFKPGQGRRLIWRRRTEMTPGGVATVVHIVGKKGGFVAAVFDNGFVLLDDNFSDDNGWLYPPEYKEFEVE
jgi:hypothetical protein